MCYKKPGPRCSYHVGRQLRQAQAVGDTQRVTELRQEYYLTPRGIQELRDQGRLVEADIATRIRQKQMLAYRAIQERDTARFEALVLREQSDSATINAALDTLEASETARVLAYARTH